MAGLSVASITGTYTPEAGQNTPFDLGEAGFILPARVIREPAVGIGECRSAGPKRASGDLNRRVNGTEVHRRQPFIQGDGMPDDRATLIRQLRERIKELECIHAISGIAANPNASFPQVLQEITDRIPTAFLQPERTCARITLGSRVAQTVGFRPCPCSLDVPVTANGEIGGAIEVGHLDARPDEGSPFLDEEKRLLQVIAARIGLVVHSNTLKDSLALSEKRYRTLVDNALVGITQSNLEGELLYANRTSLCTLGYESLEEAQAMGTLRWYRKPEARQTLLDLLAQTGRVTDCEMEYVTKTGESIFVLLNANLEGDVITGMMMDVTARKRAEDALIRSEKGLLEAQRIGRVGHWDWQVPTGELHWSDEVYRIFGLQPQQFDATYEAFLARIHPDDRRTVEDAVNQSLAAPGKPYSMEHRVFRPDGRECVVHERGEVMFDASGTPVRMMGTVHDITELKQVENENRALMQSIQEEKERLTALIESIADEVWFADTGHMMIPANVSACREFGLAPAGRVAISTLTDSLEILRPDGSPRPHGEAPPLRALAGEIVENLEEIVRTPGTGELRHRQLSAAPVRDGKGEIIGAVCVVRDITDLKRKEKELATALEEIRTMKEQLEVENIYLSEEIGLRKDLTGIIGESDPIQYVMHRIRQVAPTDTTVLLTGETGTGKGLFARFLHEASGRRDRPFVNVNCAGLPPNLIESELFGREKGAFTGATARQIGRFDLADGGTIFLDEIGELPVALQSKLLKVIEEGEFEHLGSPHPVKVDVRVIASTNRDLEEEVGKGRFRKDLFYRLNVFPITIPPLRHRKEDVGLLVNFFSERFARRHGKGVKRIHEDTMKILEDYAWPGNVRELMNVVERAVILSAGAELRLSDLALSLPVSPVPESAPRSDEGNETKAMADMEREHILRIVQAAGWRIEGEQGAAKILGMNPSTLRARMRKLGIKRP